MNDLMVDLETFGNGKNACIVQIGACYFNRTTGEIGETFKFNIDARGSNGDLDPDTVYWWLSQSKEAIASITADPKEPLERVMNEFNDFAQGAKKIWSHATFDFVILQETFRRLKIKPKFRYTVARDIRTLTDLANVTFSKVTREGLHHDALDDCKFQVKYCVECFNKIKGRQQNGPQTSS